MSSMKFKAVKSSFLSSDGTVLELLDDKFDFFNCHFMGHFLVSLCEWILSTFLDSWCRPYLSSFLEGTMSSTTWVPYLHQDLSPSCMNTIHNFFPSFLLFLGVDTSSPWKSKTPVRYRWAFCQNEACICSKQYTINKTSMYSIRHEVRLEH
jgi:hypothetical protein